VTLLVGATATLDATVTDADDRAVEDSNLEWSSSSPSVATVSEAGAVTAISPGSASIVASTGESVGFAHVVVQLDFRLPVSAQSVLRTEIGTATTLCPGGEGGLRVDGGVECSHAGISRFSLDFRAPEGNSAAQVGAAADGTVRDVCLRPPSETTCGPEGPFVYIDHGNGFSSQYSHLDPGSVTIRRKSPVLQGETIGRMGTWGSEPYAWTHFELRYRNHEPAQQAVLGQLLIEGKKLSEYRIAP
jgi:murein DD-endopeptidase MepM/ murein hydrolase activator NlpD